MYRTTFCTRNLPLFLFPHPTRRTPDTCAGSSVPIWIQNGCDLIRQG